VLEARTMEEDRVIQLRAVVRRGPPLQHGRYGGGPAQGCRATVPTPAARKVLRRSSAGLSCNDAHPCSVEVYWRSLFLP